MILRTLLTAAVFLFSGCAQMGIDDDSVGVVTTEYGQCIVNMDALPSFNKKKVTFRCEEKRVLLGGMYKKEGVEYIDSALLLERDGKYVIKDKKRVHFVRGLHSICEFQPVQGKGNKKIRRVYFDQQLKECRPYEWHGDGGFVPFKNIDECEQNCYR